MCSSGDDASGGRNEDSYEAPSSSADELSEVCIRV